LQKFNQLIIKQTIYQDYTLQKLQIDKENYYNVPYISSFFDNDPLLSLSNALNYFKRYSFSDMLIS